MYIVIIHFINFIIMTSVKIEALKDVLSAHTYVVNQIKDLAKINSISIGNTNLHPSLTFPRRQDRPNINKEDSEMISAIKKTVLVILENRLNILENQILETVK